EEWEQIQLPTPVIHTQPAGGKTLVNLETFVQGPQTPLTHHTRLLGTDVTIQATPITWHWDFGDNSEVLSVNEPGEPFPHGDVFHVYNQPGTYEITLTID